jgi:hypothetical protein
MIRERGREEAASALQPDPARHNIPDVATMDLRDADNKRLLRIDGATDDPLHRLHEGTGRQNGIVAKLRHGRVRARAFERQFEIVDGGHHGPDAYRDRPKSDARPIVNRVHRLDREAREDALLDHAHASALVFLCGLEYEIDRSVERSRLAEQLRRAKQHRRVAVMTAGMHDARLFRRVGKPRLLHDRKRVELGSQADRARAGSAAQNADHAGAADSFVNLVERERSELFGNKARCFVFLKAQFRICVNPMPPGDNLWHNSSDGVIMQHSALLAATGS